MSECERFSIVWQVCGENSDIAHRFFVPGYDGYLPFFIWGEDLTALERKEKVELREEQLLKGILYGLNEFDHHTKPWHRKQDRHTLLYLLDVLGNGFNFESPEKMILDVAYNIRERHGNSASLTVLEVGRELIPQSSKIKSDLVCDLWALLTVTNEGEDILEEIVYLVPQIELDDIHSDAKEIVCYYGLCSIVLLGMEESIPLYLEEYIYPNVAMGQLKSRINALLENPKGFRPIDLTAV